MHDDTEILLIWYFHKPLWNFIKFSTLVQSAIKMNGLDFEV